MAGTDSNLQNHGTHAGNGPSTSFGKSASARISVLYVDDEPALLEPTRLTLEKKGNFSVDTTTNASEAMRMIQNGSYDVIISDYQMPEINGIEFLRQLRSMGNAVPFIIFTGRGREDAVIEAYNAGADFYLPKGGDPKAMFLDLTHKVEQVVTRRRAEIALRESEERYRKVTEQSHDAIIITQGARFLFVNDRVSEITGYPKKELYATEIWTLLHPEDRARVMKTAADRAADRHAPRTYEARILTKGGEVRSMEFSVTHLVFNGENAMLSSVRDITERRHAEDALQIAHAELEQKVDERTRELSTLTINLQQQIAERNRYMEALAASEEKYRSLVEQIGDIVFSIDPYGIVTYISPHGLISLGLSEGSIPRISAFDIVPPEYRNRIADLLHPVTNRYEPVSGFEIIVPSLQQKRTLVLEVNAAPVYDKGGTFSGYSGIARDITERKNLENEIAASLKEKEILLKEVHHRVKNNMQVISSLLNLQVKQMKDTKSREALLESQNRVMSIALVHEKLYQSKSYVEIDYADYLKKIAQSLLLSYGIPPGKIRIDIHADDVVLPISKAIPVSLMINELLSNSLKYAFPGDRQGVITVDIHKNGKQHILIIRDNGIGLPGGIDLNHRETLGLELVSSLVGQIQGTIALNSDGGTEFRVEFSLEPSTGEPYE